MKLRNRTRAFTLLELLIVITIIGILASLLFPAWRTVSAKAESTGCTANLRQIGLALQSYLNDHDNTYPYIEPNPQISSIYPSQVGAKSMYDTFSSYGVSQKTLQCPTDMKQTPSSFSKYGSSYLWSPISDGETNTGSINLSDIFGGGRGGGGRRRGFSPQVSLQHIRIVTDQAPVHRGYSNALYADGHTVNY